MTAKVSYWKYPFRFENPKRIDYDRKMLISFFITLYFRVSKIVNMFMSLSGNTFSMNDFFCTEMCIISNEMEKSTTIQ